jgi:membrane protease YdiL (CAAX protease family)
MPTTSEQTRSCGQRCGLRGLCWREIVFWLLLLSAFSDLSSPEPKRELAGLIEACAFLVVAISSTGRLKGLGLEFVAWNRIPGRAVAESMFYGLLAGCVIVAVARGSGQPLGIEYGWNMAVLAITLGPVLEEIIFRGYLLTFALWVTRLGSRWLWSPVSVMSIAVVFAFAHVGKAGTTTLQLICIVATGCLYGWMRLTYRSTAAAAITHAMYNCALYLGYWSAL